MPWQQLSARVPRDRVAEIESLLELAGAVSITLADGGEAPLFEPLPGDTPLWPIVTIKALFAAELDTGPTLERLRGVLGGPNVHIDTLDDAELLAQALGTFAPKRIGGKLWLLSADDAAPADGLLPLRLHRGLAFGTGEHPTTALCLSWIAASLEPGTVVLDYGCGSGVLALAALRLGAERAFAIDNDPQALTAAAANAALNDLEDKIWIGLPEQLPAVQMDVILANILARPLMELAPLFHDRLVAGGRAILSGVLAEQRGDVEQAYARHGFVIDGGDALDGWARLDTTRRPTT